MVKYFTIFFLLLLSGNGNAATIYMGAEETYTNLQAAFAAMSGGDTLIIRDGTYTGAANDISHTQKPPTGADGAYTTVIAENSGSVIIQNHVLFSDLSYVRIEGLVFEGTNIDGVVEIGSATQPHHLKFINCGVFSEGSISTSERNDGFSTNSAHHILFEGCYAWGNIRYAFYAGGSSDSIIFRRCVARVDAYFSETGIAAFMIYDAQNVEVQNCIAIDMDTDTYSSDDGSFATAFYFRDIEGGYALDGVNVVGSIALNMGSGAFIVGSDGNDWALSNVVMWGGDQGSRSRYGGGSLDHMTIGSIVNTTSWSQGWYSEYSNEPITNSIVYDVTTNGIQSSGAYTLTDYNCLYGNGGNYVAATPGVHDICSENSNAIDPIDGTPGNGTAALKYLPRIEGSSDLDGAASDSGDIGATILKKIGVNGTIYGEAGYNTATDDDLWPFPNETLIKTKMAEYSYDVITGDRGFASSTAKQLNGVTSVTLTSYIWEYLGNQMPEDIYGPQHRGGGMPSGMGSFH